MTSLSTKPHKGYINQSAQVIVRDTPVPAFPRVLSDGAVAKLDAVEDEFSAQLEAPVYKERLHTEPAEMQEVVEPQGVCCSRSCTML